MSLRFPFLRTPYAALIVLAGLVAAGLVALALRGDEHHGTVTAACPRGQVREVDLGGGASGSAAGPAALYRGGRREADTEGRQDRSDGPLHCRRPGGPESFADLAAANGALASRQAAPFTSVAPGAYAHAVRQREALAARSSSIAGTRGTWSALGIGPEIANDKTFDQTNGSTLEGFVHVTGRIEDFTYDPRGKALYAAPVNGGVWRSTDFGRGWRSVGDRLPTQVVGSVAYSRAAGGTLIVLTGDPAFGGASTPGLGVYRSTNDGRTWQHALGVPSGILGFQLAVDPTNPSIVYAATGAGLFRSTDGARTFTDVRLPTGRCAGHTLDFRTHAYRDCFLANEVTDVAVQGPGNAKTPSAAPGAVIAGVGWRAGQKRNKDGSLQSPRNGIYTSQSGRRGTFTKVSTTDSNFAGGNQSAIGRIALGIARGSAQNHRVVYALVEDANKFNGEGGNIDANEIPTGVLGDTVLNGVYVSTDFGRTWKELESSTVLSTDPASGSSLAPGVGNAIGYLPGVQAWYNEWIAPDPTRQSASGVPTRLTFGLEEIWQNASTSMPQDGSAPSKFDVIGRYWNVCQFLLTGLPKCSAPSSDPTQTYTTTTHPDQHAGLYVPDGKGGVTLVAGNDGGAFTQHSDPPGGAHPRFDNEHWGAGANGTGRRALYTLQPYDAEMARDGTTYAGLQDNGELKIRPDGKQFQVFGGDGFFTAVDPRHSNIAYEEYVGGVVAVTTDGGKHWMNEDPQLKRGMFSTPFKMDPTAAKHLIIGGRDIQETIYGPDTVTCFDPTCLTVNNRWKKVFDLGTSERPGDPNAVSNRDSDPLNPGTGADNQLSAVDVRGDAAYVGYCGFCDTLTQGTPFGNGIATNVGGRQSPKRYTSRGWHIARAKGLPRRIITSLAIDPRNSRTVYATLAGYGRRWAPPGAVGDSRSGVGTGHVFKSTDAGRTFHDVSGNLPDAPANSVVIRRGQLIVATDVGVYASSNLSGGRYGLLGRTLPNTPVFHLQLKPGDDRTLVAATYGRGVYTYRFPRARRAQRPAQHRPPRRHRPRFTG